MSMSNHEDLKENSIAIKLVNVRKVFRRDTQNEQSALLFLKKIFFLSKNSAPEEKVILSNINITLKKGEREWVLSEEMEQEKVHFLEQ